MYLIEASGSAAITQIGKVANKSQYIPAEKCTWEIVADTNGGYSIANVKFFSGNAAVFALTDTNVSYTFGYIGKSGRFVEIA